MNSPLRVVYPVSLDVKATELNKEQGRACLCTVDLQHTENGHDLLRQQSQSHKDTSGEPYFWPNQSLTLSVGDGTCATVADAELIVALHRERAGKAAQPPRWLPLLSCIRPPELSSNACEPQGTAFPPIQGLSETCSVNIPLQEILSSAQLCKTFEADVPGGGSLQVTATMGQQARGAMRLSLQQLQGRPCFTDHDRRPVYEVRSMDDRLRCGSLHLPGTPLTPLKETVAAPSHDLTSPDSPSTPGTQRSALQFELRRGKGEEPVAQCILVDDTYEIELLDDGRSHLWGCIHLPPHEPGQSLVDVLEEVHVDLMRDEAAGDLCLTRCPSERLPLSSLGGKRALAHPVAWSLLVRTRRASLMPSRSPFIARLRLPRFCSGFERHAFAPCDPQTLSFSAASGYVVEPQLQLLSSPDHSQSGNSQGGAGQTAGAGTHSASANGWDPAAAAPTTTSKAAAAVRGAARLKDLQGQTTRIALWPLAKSSAWRDFGSPVGLTATTADGNCSIDMIRAGTSPEGPVAGTMRRSSRSMRRTDSLAYEPQPCELALDIAPQQAVEAPAVACLAFLLHAHAKQCQQLISSQQ
ncbi:hypothetical protein WJX84_000965 [Apatococcus fuscideae]|uniref:Uncharacterized protein n=1 Tax=Apatococcus fuscideae TaxID=2026836 RepID=A0AAW1T6Q7_9CHLO